MKKKLKLSDISLKDIQRAMVAQSLAGNQKSKDIFTPRGKTKWSDTTVLGVIKNEKYIGDILMGKTFTVDPITKRRLANFGESDKYHIENHLPNYQLKLNQIVFFLFNLYPYVNFICIFICIKG